MLKKIKKIFIVLFLCFFIVSCNTLSTNNVKSYLRISKPYTNFYTNALKYALNKKSNTIHLSVLYTKTGKNKVFPIEYVNNFNLFINSIKQNNFIDPEKLNIDFTNPEYKLTVFINNSPSFLINIFNKEIINIHPWDGIYSPDTINISSVHTKFNIYNISEYLIKNIENK